MQSTFTEFSFCATTLFEFVQQTWWECSSECQPDAFAYYIYITNNHVFVECHVELGGLSTHKRDQLSTANCNNVRQYESACISIDHASRKTFSNARFDC